MAGTIAYLALVVLLRSSGNRSPAQTRSFGFVVTVAVGAAFGVLIGLRHLVTSLQVRWGPVRQASPSAGRGRTHDRAERHGDREVEGSRLNAIKST